MIDCLIDGFNGMSTHLRHVMPKRTMSKTMEKYVNNIILFVEAAVNMIKFKVCKGDLTNSYVLIWKESRL